MAKQKTETEIRLSDLQDIYLKTRDEAAWNEMFDIMIKYARSLTLKVNKGKVYLDPEHVLSVATDSAIKIMERYKQPDFKIEFSFGGLLRWKVLESLYGNWEEDSHVSLNAIVGEDSNGKTELGDLQDSTNLYKPGSPFTVEPDEIKLENVAESLQDILDEFDEAIDSYRLSLLARLYLLLTLRKSKVRQSLSSFKTFANLSTREEQALDLLLLEMRNRLCLVS